MSEKENPFILDFGEKPDLYISRREDEDKIKRTFLAKKTSSHIFLIIGARGMGKTVLMSSVTSDIKKDDDWIHIDLSSGSDDNEQGETILKNLYRSLKDKATVQLPKINIKASLKFLSADVELNNDKEEHYCWDEIDKILLELNKNNKRVLITIDEVINSKDMREFATYYQHCRRESLPLFVLMTGLYKNIRALQNNRSLTFLKRATRVELSPLSTIRIASKYQDVLGVSESEAIKMANLTNGYSYAFQMLGYLLFESEGKELTQEVLRDYKEELFFNSYEKIWEEMSNNEREVLRIIARDKNDETAVADIMKEMNINNDNFTSYRNIIIKSGLAEMSSYGHLRLSLPFLDEYIKLYC